VLWSLEEYTMSDEKVPLKALVSPHGTVQSDVKDSAFFVIICVLLISLAPISFGYAMGYTSPAGQEINTALNLTSTQSDLYTVRVSSLSRTFSFSHEICR
jgi:hypothetical protein